MKLRITLFLIFLVAASASGSAKRCSGTTNTTCPPFQDAGGEETCRYDVDRLSVDIFMDSSKSQTVDFFSGRKEKFRIAITPDDCEQAAACKAHPFQHDFDGNDKYGIRFVTGRPQNHPGGSACQYKVTVQGYQEDPKEPFLLVIK